MFYYAVLNENNVCMGISELSGEVSNSLLIRLPSLDNDLLYRKYTNGSWSSEKIVPPTVEPQLTPEQIRIQELEQQLQQTNSDLVGFMDFYFSTTSGV
jgi:hypothetical protein